MSFIDKGTGTVVPLEHHALEIRGDGKLVRLRRTDPASVDEGVVRIAYKRGPQPRTIAYDIYLHRPAPGAKLEPIWYFMTDFNCDDDPEAGRCRCRRSPTAIGSYAS